MRWLRRIVLFIVDGGSLMAGPRVQAGIEPGDYGLGTIEDDLGHWSLREKEKVEGEEERWEGEVQVCRGGGGIMGERVALGG